MTAVDRVDCERIDHQGFVPEIFAGLLGTALWMMQIGPSISTLSDYVEDWIALLLFLGSFICLIGVILGTKLVFPRHFSRRAAYRVELVGLPIIIAPLAFLTYASVSPDSLLLTALAGGLGLTIEIGCVRLFVDLVQDLFADHSKHGHD